MGNASTITISDFTGAWNCADKPARLAPNEFEAFEDLRFTRQAIEKRPGHLKHFAAPVKGIGSDIKGLWIFYLDDGTPTFVAAISDGFYSCAAGGGTLLFPASVGAWPAAVQFGSGMYLLGGAGKMQHWSPTIPAADVGLSAPTAAPVAALAGAGGAKTGDYQYRYTYARETFGAAWESNPSLASNIITAAAQNVQVQSLPAGGYPAAAQYCYIYRRKVGVKDQFSYVAKVAVGATQWDDNVADGAEGAYCPGLGYPGTYSHGLPPEAATCICVHGNYLLLAKGRRVYISNPYRPWSFDPGWYIDCAEKGDRIIGLVEWNDIPYAVCQSAVVALLPDPGATIPWRPQTYPIASDALAPKAVCVWGGGIFWIGRQGVVRWAGGAPEVISCRISPYFSGADPAKLDDAAMAVYGDTLWLAINDPAQAHAYNDTVIKADLRVWTQQAGEATPQPAWIKHTAPASVNCFCVGMVAALTGYDSHLFAGTGNAVEYVLRLETGKNDDGANIQQLLKKTILFEGIKCEKKIARLWAEVYPTGKASDVLSVQVTVDGTASGYKTIPLSGTTYDSPVDTQLEFVGRGKIFQVELKQANKDETRRPLIHSIELEIEPKAVRP